MKNSSTFIRLKFFLPTITEFLVKIGLFSTYGGLNNSVIYNALYILYF